MKASGSCSRCRRRLAALRTRPGWSWSSARSSVHGIAGVMRSSTRCALRRSDTSLKSRSRSLARPGLTTGSSTWKLKRSKAGWLARFPRGDHEPLQLDMRNRLLRSTHTLPKKVEEGAQAVVVQRGCRRDDVGRGDTMVWLQKLREVFRKARRQMLHHMVVYGDGTLESKGHAAGRDRGRDLGAKPGRDRKEPAEAVHGPARDRDLSRAVEARRPGHRMVLGRRHQRHRHR